MIRVCLRDFLEGLDGGSFALGCLGVLGRWVVSGVGGFEEWALRTKLKAEGIVLCGFGKRVPGSSRH